MKQKKKRSISAIVAGVLFLTTFFFPITTAAQEENNVQDSVFILYEDESRRGESEKHFVLSNKTILAVDYPTVVHRLDASGVYNDIDNRLKLSEETGNYENTYNEFFNVSFSKADYEQLVSVKAADAPKLSYYTKVIKTNLELLPNPEKSEIEVYQGAENDFAGAEVKKTSFELSAFETSVLYKSLYGVSESISAKYTLYGDSIKEDLILESNNGIAAFQTEYSIPTTSVIADETGAIYFYSEKEVPDYVVEAPCMYDAAGNFCTDIMVEVLETESGCSVTYTPDSNWLNDETRQFPIVFDPHVTTFRLSTSRSDMRNYRVVNGQTTYTDGPDPFNIGYQPISLNGSTYLSKDYVGLKLKIGPEIDHKRFEVTSVSVRLKNYQQVNFSSFQSYRLTDSSLNTSGYTPSDGTFLANSVQNVSGYTDIDLDCSYYTDDIQPTYLLYFNAAPSGMNSQYYSFYCNAATSQSRPLLIVEYRDNIQAGKYIMKNATEVLLYDKNASLFTDTSIDSHAFYFSEWYFERISNGSEFCISPVGKENYVLQVNANYTVTLVSKSTPLSSSQLWTIEWVPNPYGNERIKFTNNFKDLYLDNGTLKVGTNAGTSISEWELIKSYQGVYTFENEYHESKYMGIYGGYNYNATDDLISNVILVNDSQENDQGGFRILFSPSNDSYLLMPICSGNGYYRTISYRPESAGITADVGINEIGGSTYTNLYFEIIPNTDGTVSFKTTSGKYLSVDTGYNVICVDSVQNDKEKWRMADYKYKYETSILYSTVEKHYETLEIGSPFGTNGGDMIMTSGYGPRGYLNTSTNPPIFYPYDQGSSWHNGIDVAAVLGTNLYSPCNATVAYIHRTNDGAAGRYIVLRYDSDANSNNLNGFGNQKAVYMVFMHLDSIPSSSILSVNTIVTANTFIGTTGASGKNSDTGYEEHLHIGVFLADNDISSIAFDQSPWTYSSCKINPLLVFKPDSFNVVLEQHS